MTVESLPKPERRFAQDSLPWVVGAAALAVYLATLNHWVTPGSLALIARVNGWEWQSTISQPLLYILTFPFRWLPAGWVPLALNLFTAVGAALTLMTLARSVALLPHDRLEEQRSLVENEQGLLTLRGAWVPVVLAAVALGLQLTFWEQAIAATGELLDLLLFAYIIRCLLEHRRDERPAWLDRAAFLFGCGMANNWGMVPFLPLFILALLRTKRLGFFSLRTVRRIERSGWESVAPALNTDLRFFLRMTLLGLGGLSLILLLPLLQSLSPASTLGFGPAVRTIVVSYWDTLYLLGRTFLRFRRELALLLAASSLFPVILMSIRWGAFAGGSGPARFDLASFILYIAHAFLLMICLWAVFDPPFAPRHIAHQLGLSVAFLPLYYLTALSIGYYSGFFLLLFGPLALERTDRRATVRPLLCQVVPPLVYALVGLTLAGLLLKNGPAIRAANAPHLDRYARLVVEALPPGGAIVLSDDPARLMLAQAALAREGKAGSFVAVEARNLASASYRAWLGRKYPGRWPDPEAEAKILAVTPASSQADPAREAAFIGVRLVSRLAETNRIYSVQPSFGYWPEQFYLQPHGLIHEMKPYPGDSLSTPPLTVAELAENQSFWQAALETAVNPVLNLAFLPELPRPAIQKRLMKLAHLQTPPPLQAAVLAGWYSGALNRWGVTLQRNSRYREATPCFTLAQELNPDNFPARISLQCNTNLVARQKLAVLRTLVFPEQFGRYRNSLVQMLTECGPFDDPTYCYLLGQSMAEGRMLRQACQQLVRCSELVPDDLGVRLQLGDWYNSVSRPEKTFALVDKIKAAPELRPLGPKREMEVELLEARAWFAQTNRPMAEGIIYALLATHPGDPFVLERVGATFTACQRYADALRTIDRLLQLAPDDPAALASKGNICLLSGDYSNAIPLLTLSLSRTNTFVSRLNRASAYLQLGLADAAEADYQEIVRAFPNAYRASAILGEIAWQKHDTNTAIRYYEQYLSQAAADTDDGRFVAARLESIRRSRR